MIHLLRKRIHFPSYITTEECQSTQDEADDYFEKKVRLWKTENSASEFSSESPQNPGRPGEDRTEEEPMLGSLRSKETHATKRAHGANKNR